MKKLLLVSLCFLMLFVTQVYAQNRTVTGTVTSKDDGLPLPGVSVTVVGSQTGTVTNSAGSYSLKVPAGSVTLRFGFIGFASQNVAVGANNVANVALATDAKQLGEVMVTAAGGIQRKTRELGFQATRVTAAQLTQGKAPTVAAGLTGKVAGLQINAVSSGVNPNYRLVLRGNRSLTGNNQALLVLDNVITPSAVLGNLNPEDIEDVNVLNGAAAAALYGQDASNGALVITTKKGKAGVTEIKFSHLTTFEQVSFYPKLQNEFGSGSTSNIQVYDPIENQQFGPAFDGSMRQIGLPFQDGSVQTVKYAANRDKYDFWETGVTNQEDISLTSGDDKSTFFLSGQYLNTNGTTIGDNYKRYSFRLNGTRDFGNKLKALYSVNYVQNDLNTSTATATIYDQLLQTPAQIPLLSYKDYTNNIYANPNGYYNGYYANPYFTAANNRNRNRNSYVTGNFDLNYDPLSWLGFTYRLGVSNRSQFNKSYTGQFTFTPYALSVYTSKSNIAGGVSDGSLSNVQLNSEFQIRLNKSVNDFTFKGILAASVRQNTYKTIGVSANGIFVPGLYNVSNRIGEAGAGESNFLARQQAIYGDATIGYKNYLFLHLTGRNDWVSQLSPENRSFFYPAADVSFVASDAFDFFKDSKVIDVLKLRAGVSKVGNVNLEASSGNQFGAYALLPIFSPTSGFPYGSLGGYSQSSSIVSPNLRPEITKAYEFGADFTLLNNRVDGSVTYYHSSTTDQTVNTTISNATGFTQYLINTGEVTNSGIESALHITPYRSANGFSVTVGGNYTYLKNIVNSINANLPRLLIGNGNAYAVEGQPFPALLGTDYNRDDQGRVIVDPVTGYPSANSQTTVIGYSQPKHRLGLDLEVRYKGLRFTTLFEYRGSYSQLAQELGGSLDFSGSSLGSTFYGRERFVFPNSSYLDPATNTYVANTTVLTADGGAGFWPSGNFNRNITTNYLYSGNYWKWREVSLAYTLPKSLLANLKVVKTATVSLQGRNLFLWVPKTNRYTDPDFNNSDNNAIGITGLGQTPPTRYYGASVSVTF
ncbi:SusC/RagA family TonB-linked outer membrane protein [Mucilaginibacter pallidiroseus]|uniref:SusC/RagA family TonB-linked outer membrane protein n=1 Tax=Mucilaginibacter pallidiroseus TaxID=2599295 RepID=A0A563UEW5_9SPHI|nr:SusC/RagA family TonB-linked outer membrane protein [Mucilaginibacter pallidiroseus]TWR29799.1 SusC/RagA family TonB-linked outer membrane protein [Mucilaginibacter pallidiroseus]